MEPIREQAERTAHRPGIAMASSAEERRSEDDSAAKSLWCKMVCCGVRRPAEELTQKGEAMAKTSTVDPAAAPLPPEWQEVDAPDGGGDMYFWNTETDEVTWERPKPGRSSDVALV